MLTKSHVYGMLLSTRPEFDRSHGSTSTEPPSTNGRGHVRGSTCIPLSRVKRRAYACSCNCKASDMSPSCRDLAYRALLERNGDSSRSSFCASAEAFCISCLRVAVRQMHPSLQPSRCCGFCLAGLLFRRQVFVLLGFPFSPHTLSPTFEQLCLRCYTLLTIYLPLEPLNTSSTSYSPQIFCIHTSPCLLIPPLPWPRRAFPLPRTTVRLRPSPL